MGDSLSTTLDTAWSCTDPHAVATASATWGSHTGGLSAAGESRAIDDAALRINEPAPGAKRLLAIHEHRSAIEAGTEAGNGVFALGKQELLMCQLDSWLIGVGDHAGDSLQMTELCIRIAQQISTVVIPVKAGPLAVIHCVPSISANPAARLRPCLRFGELRTPRTYLPRVAARCTVLVWLHRSRVTFCRAHDMMRERRKSYQAVGDGTGMWPGSCRTRTAASPLILRNQDGWASGSNRR